jgi:hypothetical protein
MTEDGPMQTCYVGLDVHSRESVFVVENDAGAMIARGSVPTTVNGLQHLRDGCGLTAGSKVARETGTSAFFVARELARLELKPVVIDAHEVRRKARRPGQKSDTRDTLELCEGLRRGFYRAVVHVCLTSTILAGGVGDELAARQLQNLGFRHALERLPVHLIERLDVGQARFAQQPAEFLDFLDALTRACVGSNT